MTTQQAFRFFDYLGIRVYSLSSSHDPVKEYKYLLFHPDQKHYSFCDSLISLYGFVHKSVTPAWRILDSDSSLWQKATSISSVHELYTGGHDSMYQPMFTY